MLQVAPCMPKEVYQKKKERKKIIKGSNAIDPSHL
ncbi:hypothetical protein QG37_07734 [Candidozyma auris]|nr:hypothetical protein QG37_07734 [[Candida] auris]